MSAYDSFMGRYSTRLAPLFADFAGIGASGRAALDVGCGARARSRAELASRLRRSARWLPPTRRTSLVDAMSIAGSPDARRPRWRRAEALSRGRTRAFDAALAQLVVNVHGTTPPAGVREMRRVRPATGGVVGGLHLGSWPAACAMLAAVYRDAAVALDANAPDEAKARRFQHAPRSSTRSGVDDRPARRGDRAARRGRSMYERLRRLLDVAARARDRACRRIWLGIARRRRSECRLRDRVLRAGSASRTARSRWLPVPGPCGIGLDRGSAFDAARREHASGAAPTPIELPQGS